MVKAIRVYELGGPEVLKWEDIEISDPKEGEIRVKNKAIGVNFIDIYYRTGVYKVPEIPYTPGVEAVGVVTAIGPGVNDLKVGDMVYHSGSGTYTEEQIVLADKATPLPPIDPLVVASVMVKGLTAHFLVKSWFKVEEGVSTVIGTVSTKEKALQAKEDGCHHVIIYKEEDFVTRVNEITSGQGVEVVFDSVGKDTFEGSLACLKHRGYMISYGQSSGTPDPVPLSALAAKSLFLARPSLRTSRFSRDEMREATKEVLTNVASGTFKVLLC
nr:alcohol dehydrogenase superfamily, zinc-type [Tanacetum cinerariifolium]